ncbi:hypothetical protein MLD38_010015 [Melastoma candidum]|uniref:Uncharacterized protein n=1 Tax=Melastoma candidum TaxID=119954 RepID=A0ACB9R6V0_9MYRT|nr:hypothetical protein MLD38_010015 [Melastoma candidum]
MASNSESVTHFFRVLFTLTLTVVLGACIAGGARYSLGEMVEEDPQELPTNCESVHVVVAGDTCFDIARQFNLTTAELVAINPNIVCEKLIPGQSLCVEAKAEN